MKKEPYKLLDLPYAYNALGPYMSEETLKLHHDKHHAAYVNNANAILEKPWDVRNLKSMSFNVGGHLLHEIFWITLRPATGGENKPTGELMKAIEENFSAQGGPASGWEEFKKQFSEAAKTVECSGWAALAYDSKQGSLAIIQIEKHNVNLYPEQKILMCLDVWEHAYYVDYKNDRAKFIENWWNIINWEEVNERFLRCL